MTLVYFNSFVALAIALVAAASIRAMNGSTNHAVRLAVVVMLIGALGESLGFWIKQWDHYVDTVLYSGILALLIANLRSPAPIPPRWSGRLAIVTLVLGTLVVLGYLAIAPAQAKNSPHVTSAWLVKLQEDPREGTVTLSRADFDDIVGAYNAYHAEVARLRVRGCR